MADDGGAGVHEAGDDLRVDFGAAEALLVLDDDVLEDAGLVVVEAEAGGACFHLVEERGVRIDRVEDVDEAFFEREHVEEVAGLHGGHDAALEGIGEHVDGLQVAFEVVDALVEQPEDDILDREDAERGAALEERGIVRHDDDDAVLVNEDAGGGELEEEVVVGGKTFRALEDDGGVVGLEFEAGEFVGVERGMERVVVDFVELHEVRLVLDGGGVEDDDLGFVGLAADDRAGFGGDAVVTAESSSCGCRHSAGDGCGGFRCSRHHAGKSPIAGSASMRFLPVSRGVAFGRGGGRVVHG